jgi:hypothetical protein
MELVYRRCKLPSTYKIPTLPSANLLLKVESCSGSTSTVPFLGVGGQAARDGGHGSVLGSTKTVIAQARTDGASDGTQGYSWEMTVPATASFFAPLESPPMVCEVAAGVPQTITVHTADDVDLNDDQLWMVVEHPDGSVTNAEPNHTVIMTKPDPLATPSAVARDSGSTWGGAGTGTDGSTGQQKLVSDVFTPTVAGLAFVRVYLAKASAVMYVDPKPEVN